MAISEPEARFRLRGALSYGGALILGRLVQAASFFFMAHRFSEEQMGVLAMLTVMFIGFYQLTNLGVERYVVYARDSTPEALRRTIDTVWTLQLLRGGLVGLSVIPVTLAINSFPGFELGFAEVLGVATAIMLLSVANPALSAFERGGDFNLIARARALSVSLGGVVTILLVLAWPEPWVYVAGQIVSAAVFAALSFHFTVEWPRISFDLSRMFEVFRYTKHLLIIAAVSFLSAQFQNVYIGAMFGAAVLGPFFTWLRTVNLPRELLTQFTGRILYAAANDRARREAEYGRAHLAGFALMMGSMLPFHLFVWFHGDLVIAVLAGEKWHDYWWAGRMIALVSIAHVAVGTVGPFMLTVCPQVSSTLRTIEAIAAAGLMLLLGPTYGVGGVLASMLAVRAWAIPARIFFFYRLIVTRDRAAHARGCTWVLLGASAPFLAAEALLLPSAEAMSGELGVVMVYAAVFMGLAAVGLRFRAKLLYGPR